MHKGSTYGDYVTDTAFLREYNAYQTKYATQMRESDKVLVRLIGEVLAKRTSRRPLRLLDIGCSTGNLLLHLKRLFPELELAGGDLAESSLEQCRANPDLRDVRFEMLDMLNLGFEDHFDIVVANAVAVYFSWDEYKQAASSVARALTAGGTYLAFEWLHRFQHQDIVITETTLSHPNGLRICFRPITKVSKVLNDAGFSEVHFLPFELPIDLAFPGHDTEVVSYTRKTADGENLCFRGTLFQPWCHVIARKA
jgi:SAM-dependent methyltransferase